MNKIVMLKSLLRYFFCSSLLLMLACQGLQEPAVEEEREEEEGEEEKEEEEEGEEEEETEREEETEEEGEEEETEEEETEEEEEESEEEESEEEGEALYKKNLSTPDQKAREKAQRMLGTLAEKKTPPRTEVRKKAKRVLDKVENPLR